MTYGPARGHGRRTDRVALETASPPAIGKGIHMHRQRGAARARAAALIGVPLTLALALALLAGCSSSEPEALVLASTTSTQDSGLFDELIPAFEEAYPEYEVEVLAVGTGEALALGETGDADVLLVHAKTSEEELVEAGYGLERRDVMYNDFIIVGPEDDPAGVAGMEDASEALAMISEAEAEFVSRGDDSGTHKKELALWEAAGIEPEGDWYVSAGQGMGAVLRMASETDAYTLTDRATYLAQGDDSVLLVHVEGDDALFNQYGVIPIADAANPEGAEAFTDWITSEEGQEVIASFTLEGTDDTLFTPNASE
jgi:tungstate transport system substrate-binding protein